MEAVGVFMQSVSKKWMIVGGVFGMLILIGLIIAITSGRPSNKSKSSSHVDAFSGETVSSPAGKTPETFGTTAEPLKLGFDKLLNYGISIDQLGSIEAAFNTYSNTLKQPPKQISVSAASITSQDNFSDPTAPFVILFKVQFDSANIYQAKDVYTGLSDARLILLDSKTSQQLYDSGVISTSPS